MTIPAAGARAGSLRSLAVAHHSIGRIWAAGCSKSTWPILQAVRQAPPLTPDQVRFVKRVNEYFEANAGWPPENELRRAFAQDEELDVFKAGVELADWYLLLHADAKNAVALRIAALHAAYGETPATRDFMTLLRLAISRWKERGTTARLEERELAEHGLPREHLRALDRFFETNAFMSGPSGNDSGYYYDIHSGIEPFLKAGTLDDFLNSLWDERYRVRSASEGATPNVDKRRVFIVHGRNSKAAIAMGELVRAFGLDPVLFRDALPQTEKATPYIGEVLRKVLDGTYASIVVMTPDDVAQLRPSYARPSDPDYETRLTGQARPNVLFEAGLSWATHGDARTVIVEIGTLRPLTDLAGLHTVHFDGSPQARREIGGRLETAKCPVKWNQGDWLKAGDFAEVVRDLEVVEGRAASEQDDLIRQPGAFRRPTIDLVWADKGNVQRLDLGPEEQKRWSQSGREALSRESTNLRPAAMLTSLAALGDARSRGAYEKEVDAYLNEALPRLRARALANAVRMKLGRLVLDLANLGEENYAQVEVELVIAGPFVAYFEPRDVEDYASEIMFPSAPREWGKGFLESAFSSRYFSPILSTTPDPFRGDVANSNAGTTITYAAEDLRPKRTARLWPIHVFALGKFDANQVVAQWSHGDHRRRGRRLVRDAPRDVRLLGSGRRSRSGSRSFVRLRGPSGSRRSATARSGGLPRTG